MGDLPKRLGVALWGIPLLLLSVHFGGLLLEILISLFLLFIAREWKRIGECVEAHVSLILLWLGAAAVLVFQFSSGSRFSFGFAVFLFLTIFTIEVFRASSSPLKNLGHLVLWVFYIVIPISLWWTIRQPGGVAGEMGGRWLIVFLISVWTADTAAYAIGKSFGKHKLMPKASPNKSWEGAIAGFVAVPLIVLIAKWCGYLDFSFLDIVAFTIAVGLFGQMGDLLESRMKREAGLKDTSQFLPGHGGLLDRVDSLLLATPMLYLYLLIR